MKRILAFILTLVLTMASFTGCSADGGESAENVQSNIGGSTAGDSNDAQGETVMQSSSDMFSQRDTDAGYDESNCIKIQLSGSSATASSDSVRISGSVVTITQEGTYFIAGTLDDGMLVVDAPDTAKVQLVLGGVTIHSASSAALYILEADKVFVTLADATQNALSNGGEFVAVDEENIDGALFSKQDLTINGSGSLTVVSPAGHGIVCKDDLVFTGGHIVIEAASHGVDANDSVRLGGSAAITITAGKDGVHCENTDSIELGFFYADGGALTIEAQGDGIAVGAYAQILGGRFDVLAGGGSVNGSSATSGNYGDFRGGGPGQPFDNRNNKDSAADENSTSMKGLKAVGNIVIGGGEFTIDSADDAIHSDASVTLSGGEYTIKSGDDAVHAEQTLTVTDGAMQIETSYEGLEALEIYVQGGEIELHSSDDGLNASGGVDGSGMGGGRDAMFGGGHMGGGFAGGGASNGCIEISGGTLRVYAGGDGLDANGTLTISGGYTYVANPTSGDTSVLDSDSEPIITGGVFVSTGITTMMAQSFSSQSTQGVIACTTGTQQAGSVITVLDNSGAEILSYEAEYTCVLVIISSPEIIKGESYTLSVGSVSGEIQAS